MVKGRGTEVGVGGEPSKEGVKRGVTGERGRERGEGREENGSRRSRHRVGSNRGWKRRARRVAEGGEGRRERGTPRAPRGRGSFIPGSRLPTSSSRVSPSRGPATCRLPLASTEPLPPRPCPLIFLAFSAIAEPLILLTLSRYCYCCCKHHRSLFPSPSWHLREDRFRTRPS